MAKKRDELQVVSKRMTLLQCQCLVEKLESDMQTLIAHENYALPHLVLKDLQMLSASLEHLVNREKDR